MPALPDRTIEPAIVGDRLRCEADESRVARGGSSGAKRIRREELEVRANYFHTTDRKALGSMRLIRLTQ